MTEVIFMFPVLLFFTINAYGQIKPNLSLQDLQGDLNKKYSFQFSSLVVKGDSLILAAEKCEMIYILNKWTLEIISKKPLPDKKLKSIEGMTLYKNRYLLMLDEGSVAIYMFDLFEKDTLIKIADSTVLCNNNDLLEGIAINETKSLCYILHEIKGEMYIYYILDNMILQIKDTIKIPNNYNWTRYTDLCYNNDTLYVLKTNFKKDLPVASLRYAVDIMKTNQAGLPQIEDNIYVDLDSCKKFKSPKGIFSTNMEGLSIDNNTFYIVSDNEWGQKDNCDKIDNKIELTLLVKFIKNWQK